MFIDSSVLCAVVVDSLHLAQLTPAEAAAEEAERKANAFFDGVLPPFSNIGNTAFGSTPDAPTLRGIGELNCRLHRSGHSQECRCDRFAHVPALLLIVDYCSA